MDYTATIDSVTWNATSYDRNGKGEAITHAPEGLVYHSCEGTAASSLPELTKLGTGKSAQYYILRTGKIYQLLADNRRAWAAGLCRQVAGLKDWNLAINIELEHKAGQDWPEAQLEAAAQLGRMLIKKYRLRRDRVQSHRNIAIYSTGKLGRKSDPTDWPEADFSAWADRLFLPSWAGQAEGVDLEFSAAWASSGGVWLPGKLTPGLPLGPAFEVNGIKVQRFERGIAKLTPAGVAWALLSEVAQLT